MSKNILGTQILGTKTLGEWNLAKDSGKKIVVKKLFGPRNILVKRSVAQKEIFAQKIYGPQKIGSQMFGSPWQLAFAKDGPSHLPLKFSQNQVSNSWDIADIEFVWVGVCKVIFKSNQIKIMLGWVELVFNN